MIRIYQKVSKFTKCSSVCCNSTTIGYFCSIHPIRLNKTPKFIMDIQHETKKSPIFQYIFSALKTQKSDDLCYGFGHNNSSVLKNFPTKFWISPCSQLEFQQSKKFLISDETLIKLTHGSISSKDFINQRFHYLGYDVLNQFHQIYFFCGKTAPDSILIDLPASYFAKSITLDKNWKPIKQNFYAVRVPMCKDTICFLNKHNLFDIVDLKKSWINLSHRVSYDCEKSEEFAASWLHFETHFDSLFKK